jgi:hypothetical protein
MMRGDMSAIIAPKGRKRGAFLMPLGIAKRIPLGQGMVRG